LVNFLLKILAMIRKSIPVLILLLALPLILGFIAGQVTATNIPIWYASINKPWFNPPSFVFAPVWTTLYLLMGYASYRIWQRQDGNRIYLPLSLYFSQLALNFLWTFLFFSYHRPDLAFVEILLMWLLILLTIFQFARIDKPAAWMLVPYISWVSFASVLTYYIMVLNPA